MAFQIGRVYAYHELRAGDGECRSEENQTHFCPTSDVLVPSTLILANNEALAPPTCSMTCGPASVGLHVAISEWQGKAFD
jgi:hypothetical protein